MTLAVAYAARVKASYRTGVVAHPFEVEGFQNVERLEQCEALAGTPATPATDPDCGSSIILDAGTCSSAAGVLGINYASEAGSEWASGCIVHGGSAYFTPVVAGSTDDRGDGGVICADGTTYERREGTPATTCGETVITTQAACEDAAAQLNFTFTGNAGTDWESGCLIHGGSVHYSDHSDESTQNPTDGYICQSGDDTAACAAGEGDCPAGVFFATCRPCPPIYTTVFYYQPYRPTLALSHCRLGAGS